MKTKHIRPHKCPVTSCEYAEKGLGFEPDCRRHIDAKHKGDQAKRHKCDSCSHTSKSRDNLTEHIRRQHPEKCISDPSELWSDSNQTLPAGPTTFDSVGTFPNQLQEPELFSLFANDSAEPPFSTVSSKDLQLENFEDIDHIILEYLGREAL